MKINLDPATVQSWILDPSTNNGIILTNNGTGTAAVLSHTTSVQALRPKLTITYK